MFADFLNTETCKNMKQKYLLSMLLACLKWRLNLLKAEKNLGFSFTELFNDNGRAPFSKIARTTYNPSTIAPTKSSQIAEKLAEITEKFNWQMIASLAI